MLRVNTNDRLASRRGTISQGRTVFSLCPKTVFTSFILSIACDIIEINNKVRERQGRGATPEIGDKIIGLTNHWGFTSTDGLWPLTNGCIGTITNYQIIQYNYPSFIYNKQLQYMFTGMDIPNGRFESIPIDYDALITGTPAFDNKQAFRMNSFARNSDALEAPYYFAYAYAITVWKAQGSEWDKVLLIEEAHPFDTLEH